MCLANRLIVSIHEDEAHGVLVQMMEVRLSEKTFPVGQEDKSGHQEAQKIQKPFFLTPEWGNQSQFRALARPEFVENLANQSKGKGKPREVAKKSITTGHLLCNSATTS